MGQWLRRTAFWNEMGWHWQTPTLFMREGRSHSGLLERPESWWRRQAGTTKIPPEQRNDLRELLCGCVWTQKRQFDCRGAETSMCLFLWWEPEDEEHILWRCPRREMLRIVKQAPSDVDRTAWPPFTSRCGIILEDPESAAGAHVGPSTRTHSISRNTLPDSVLSDERFGRETWSMKPSRPGLMEHVSGERAVVYSSASTMGVSRRTTARSCWLSALRCKSMMGISRSDRTVNM